MNPLVDEYRTGALARTLLLLHGPARRRTLCSMMYLADADHYELYELEISWTPCIMTEDGPEPLGFEDVIAIRQLGIRRDGDILSADSGSYSPAVLIGRDGDTMWADRRFLNPEAFGDSEMRVIFRVADLAKELGEDGFTDFVMGDTPIRIAETGKRIDLDTVFYRDDDRSVREYDEDR